MAIEKWGGGFIPDGFAEKEEQKEVNLTYARVLTLGKLLALISWIEEPSRTPAQRMVYEVRLATFHTIVRH